MGVQHRALRRDDAGTVVERGQGRYASIEAINLVATTPSPVEGMLQRRRIPSGIWRGGLRGHRSGRGTKGVEEDKAHGEGFGACSGMDRELVK